MPDSYTITVAHPARCLHPNARAHWAVKAKAKRWARENAFCVAKAGYTRPAQLMDKPPRWTHATIQIHAYYKTNRRRDKDNIVAWLKSTLDGIADAGIVENDSAFDAPTVEIWVHKNAKPRIEIVVTKGETT